MIRSFSVALGLLVAGCAIAAPVEFDWFEYTGHDESFAQSLPSGHYRNPILAGFYPDPSITRAGDKFYLVSSTFAFFPGIPLFESEDLVHWKQIGNAIDRASQLPFAGLGVSRGVFAPTIEHDGDLFYIFNTHVDAGGNFVVTARNPAGPWSDPTWLPDLVDGIDPSMFVDDDGRAYLLNNGPPEGAPQYDGHRAIWIQEFDRRALATKGPRKVLVNGGIDPSSRPIWIEGPHLFKRDGWYYLNCAEGGTGPQHSQVILRSRSPLGPFVAGPNNPILTQRGLPADRAHPITNAGHADLVQAQDGTWWATFLASRLYDERHYNTGRETFLLPVTWQDGWPKILAAGVPIPTIVKGPSFMRDGAQSPWSGNFTWRDDFTAPTLDPVWMQLRTDERALRELTRKPGVLSISARGAFDGKTSPAFLARRQQHLAFNATLALRPDANRGTAAGLMLFQNEAHWLFLGVRREGQRMSVFVEKQRGQSRQLVASATVAAADAVQLKAIAHERRYSFSFRSDDGGWQQIVQDEDGSILSTDTAGGFVGAVLGPYVRSE
jgi:xylan 1,4-beta-xylosidase